MSSSPITRVVVIQNEHGLHARPASMVARLALQFESKIEIEREGRRVDGRSIMDLLTLGAAKGTELKLVAEGSDAQAAIDALAELVESGFNEDDAGN